MRIDLYNSAASQIAGDLSSQQVGTQGNSRSAASSGGLSGDDRTSFSSGAAAVASLVSAALSSPDIRQGKVDSLRQAISAGQYRVDPTSVAASMVGETQ